MTCRLRGGGGEIRNAEAARLRNGLEEFVAAEGEPFGSSYASILWGRLEPGTRLGYVAALWQFLRYSRVHGWLSPREALEGRLLEIARDGYFEGPVKKVLSGLRMAEKAGVIQFLVRRSDWIFSKSLEKLRTKKNSRRMQWSPSAILYEVAAGKRTFTWPEMECIALAALSLCNLLRIGEAWTAHRSGLGQLVFRGEKSRPGIQVQDVGPWADRWLRFLDEEPRGMGGEWCSGVQLLIPERIGSPVGRIRCWVEPQVLALAWAPTWRRSTGMGSWGSRSPLAAHGRVVYTISGGLVCNAHSRLGIRESTTTASPSARRRGTQSGVWGVVSPSVVGYVGPKRNP